MVLEGIRPRDGQGVYLNEELVLTFSQPVDPASVTSSSLSIVSDQGKRARGEWLVQGRSLRFVPSPVLRPNLDDGGYTPGARYTLACAGFPRLDGLRGLEGEPLTPGFRWTFTTVQVGPDRVVFDDVSPERAHPLRPDPAQLGPMGARLSPGEPIVLICSEPLDPSSLLESDFSLKAVETRHELVGGKLEKVLHTTDVPVTAVLRANYPEGSRGFGAPCAELELFPREPLSPGDYVLNLSPVLHLTDFHGNPVPPEFGMLDLRVEVSPDDMSTRCPSLSFLDASERSPLAVPGADGLALWEGGRVTVRYPAAAGTGVDGAIGHGHPLTPRDVHAIRVQVPAGETLELAPGRGLRVLRSQLGLSLDGRLTRSIGPDAVPRGPREDEDPFMPGETLSEFLARITAEDWDWTVIVAGGDLSVAGSLEVDTPLLLVAGGWIRVSGSVRHAPRQLWLMGDGGGVGDQTASPPRLIFDAPRTNQLLEPLRVAVISSSLPSAVREYRWTGVKAGGDAGAGRWTIGFLPQLGAAHPDVAVGHPRLLPDAGPLRVLIEIEVPSAADQLAARGDLSWEVPYVDFVDLHWEDSE